MARGQAGELALSNASKIRVATLMADNETTVEAGDDAVKTIAKATRAVDVKHRVTGEMILQGKAPDSTNEKIDHIAVATLNQESRFGAAVRRAGSRRSLKYGVVLSGMVGLADSTQAMATLDNASLASTGVGYKAWMGLGWLAIGTIVDTFADRAKTDKGFKDAIMVSDFSLQLADVNLSLEAYNLGVTRGSRVRNVVKGLMGQGPISEVTGLGGGRRGGRNRLEREEGAGRLRQLVGAAVQQIDADDVEGIAYFFGIDPQTQDDLASAGQVEEILPFFGPQVFA
jgi:hypothetical protein